MAKRRKPDGYVLPDSVWLGRGRFHGASAPAAVRRRLARLREDGTVDEFRSWGPDDGPLHGFDARWRVAGGTVVRATLALDRPRPVAVHRWLLVAEAADRRRWDHAWPSPAGLFFPRQPDVPWDCDAERGELRYRAVNVLQLPAGAGRPRREEVARSRAVLAGCADAPWAITLLVHDVTLRRDVPAVREFVPGLLGRLLELRVPNGSLDAANRLLREHGVRLPRGGAVILPTRPDRPGVSGGEREVPDNRLGMGRPDPLVTALTAFAGRPWVLPRALAADVEPALARLRGAGQGGDAAAPAAGAAPPGGEDGPPGERRPRPRQTPEVRRLRGELARAAADRDAARAAAGRLRDELEAARAELTRLREEQAHAGEAARDAGRRRAEAERALDAAEELLDDQAREIRWLRGELARTGRPFAAAPAAPAAAGDDGAPGSWEELADRAAAELPRVWLGDVVETARSLRAHALEPTWLRRAWEALQTLDAYARAKVEAGPQVLPHLTAYLRWPKAPVVIPATRYSPGESETVLGRARLRDARRFRVPPAVAPGGTALMPAHIRIGSGKPPAPRLHFLDHSSCDGLVYVGYIGRHLANTRTN